MYEREPELAKAPVTMPDLIDWRERSRTFQSIASLTPATAALTGGDRPEQLVQAVVTTDFFRTLGVAPVLGRDFVAEEGTQGRSQVLILSDSLFRRRFGGDRRIIGRTLKLDGAPVIVLGVLPRDFQFVNRWRFVPDVWTPMVLERNEDMRGSHDRLAVGRLRAGVSLPQAQREMSAIAARLEREHPATNANIGANLVAIREDTTGSFHDMLLALLGAVSFILLIACANVANLLLARGASRRQEFAVRAAMGAGRGRLAAQLMTESLLLAVVGGGLGLLLAYGGVYVLRGMETLNVPRLAASAVNGAVLLYSCLITLGAGLLFGLLPALTQSRRDLNAELKQSGDRSGAGGGRASRLRGVLVAAELSLAVILLIGAGLMVLSVVRLLGVDPGFRPEGVITMRLSVPQSRYGSDAKMAAFARGLMDRVRALPSVTAASLTNRLPLQGGPNGTLIVQGQPYSLNQWEGPLVENSYVLPGYFKAMGIPLRLGRVFAESDLGKDSSGVIVNEAFVRVLLKNASPLGQHVSKDRNPPHWREIIGVVADTRQHGLSNPPLPELYQPAAGPGMILVAHTPLEPTRLIDSIRRELAAVDKDVPIADVATMRQVLDLSAAPTRTYMQLIAAFAAVALVLASVGIYGLIAFSMSQRQHEIGIRMALGATARSVVAMAVGDAGKLVAAGLGLGIAGALLLTKYLQSVLYSVSPFDALTFITVPVLLGLVALAASLVPAMRASAVDPARALRHE